MLGVPASCYTISVIIIFFVEVFNAQTEQVISAIYLSVSLPKQSATLKDGRFFKIKLKSSW